MWVPFIGVPFIIMAFPLLLLPPFNETGHHVEYVFISVALTSGTAWTLFTVYFGAVWYFVVSYLAYEKLHSYQVYLKSTKIK